MLYALIKANYYCDPAVHHFNEDIRDITLSHKEGIGDDVAAEHIRQHIPEHDVLLAGFPLSAVFSGWRIEKELTRTSARFCL